jgi:Glucosidase II beta subunit-like protein
VYVCFVRTESSDQDIEHHELSASVDLSTGIITAPKATDDDVAREAWLPLSEFDTQYIIGIVNPNRKHKRKKSLLPDDIIEALTGKKSKKNKKKAAETGQAKLPSKSTGATASGSEGSDASTTAAATETPSDIAVADKNAKLASQSKEIQKLPEPTKPAFVVPPGGTVVTMVGKSGTQFECIIPPPLPRVGGESESLDETTTNEQNNVGTVSADGVATIPDSAGSSAAENADNTDADVDSSKPSSLVNDKEDDDENDDEEDNIPDIADTLRTVMPPSMCLVTRLGYWSYKVCPFKEVTQFHQKGTKVEMEFNLGTYDKDLDETSIDGAYAQSFSGGTDGRKTTVNFVCSKKLPA